MTEQQVRKCYSLVAIMPFTRYIQGTVESSVCVYISQVKCRVEENWSKVPFRKNQTTFFQGNQTKKAIKEFPFPV